MADAPSSENGTGNGHPAKQSANRRRAGNNGNLTPWMPGECGNPNGRPKGAVSLTRILRETLKEQGEEEAKAVVRTYLQAAKKGSLGHGDQIWARIDGKVPDKIIADITVTELEPEQRVRADRISRMLARQESAFLDP